MRAVALVLVVILPGCTSTTIMVDGTKIHRAALLSRGELMYCDSEGQAGSAYASGWDVHLIDDVDDRENTQVVHATYKPPDQLAWERGDRDAPDGIIRVGQGGWCVSSLDLDAGDQQVSAVATVAWATAIVLSVKELFRTIRTVDGNDKAVSIVESNNRRSTLRSLDPDVVGDAIKSP